MKISDQNLCNKDVKLNIEQSLTVGIYSIMKYIFVGERNTVSFLRPSFVSLDRYIEIETFW